MESALEKPPAVLHDAIKFTVETVHRSLLRNAPYNPRSIKDKARKKLKANLKRVGLLEPPVWNRTTGNIVGGHQRVALLDDLHGTPDYLIPVAVVELDAQTEKEQNVFLNNPSAQGMWDLPKLDTLLKFDRIDLEHAGLDINDAVERFGEQALHGADQLKEMAERLRAAQAGYEQLKKATAATDEATFYRVVVFKDAAGAEWLARLCEQPECIFLEGRRLRGWAEEHGASKQVDA